MKTIIIALMVMLCGVAYGGGDHHNDTVTNNYYTDYYQSDGGTTVINDSYADGTAAVMAMDGISFDTNTSGLQIGIGGGWYEDKKGQDHYGAAVGFGTQIRMDNQSKGLLNGKFTIEDGGGRGANAGFTWKF